MNRCIKTRSVLAVLLILVAISAFAQNPPYVDPVKRYVGQFSFVVTTGLANIHQHFTSVSEIVSKTRVLKNGNAKTTFDPITLTRIYTGKDDLYAWRLEVESGVIVKRDITIDVLDSTFNIVRIYTITGAWPSKWIQAPMSANSKQGPKERITLTFDSVEVVDATR